MRITDIKINGEKLEPKQLEYLAKQLHTKIKQAGFVTNAFVVNSSRIDINHRHMSYCKINTKRRGYNYRVNLCTVMATKTGYKRTDTLTWDQRVELNNIINDILDSHRVVCRVQSREVLVRCKTNDLNHTAIRAFAEPEDRNGNPSFQPNFHDWIYDNEFVALRSVEPHYPDHAKRVQDDRFNKKFDKIVLKTA